MSLVLTPLERQQAHNADVLLASEAISLVDRDQINRLYDRLVQAGARIDDLVQQQERQQDQQTERFRVMDERFGAAEAQQRSQAEAIQRLQAQPKTWAEVFKIVREMLF